MAEQIAVLPNGTKVAVPDGADVNEYMNNTIMPAYQAGQFGPVAGNKMEMPGVPWRALGKAVAQPGTVIEQGLHDAGLPQPESTPAKALAFLLREGVNMSPSVALGGGLTTSVAGAAPVVASRLGGILTRVGVNSGLGAMAPPTGIGGGEGDAKTGALIGGASALVGEGAAPAAMKVLSKFGLGGSAAKRLAESEGPGVAKRISDLIENEVPALSSTGVHPNLPSLPSRRLGVTEADTPGKLYDLLHGGRFTEAMDEVAESVKDAVKSKVGNLKLALPSGKVDINMGTGVRTPRPRMLSFEEAWLERSKISSALKDAKGIDRFELSKSLDAADQNIKKALTTLDPSGAAAQSFESGIDEMAKAHGVQEFVGKGFKAKTGDLLIPNALRELANKEGPRDITGTAASRTTGKLGPLYDSLQDILHHNAGQAVPTPPMVLPGKQAAVDAALAQTEPGKIVSLMTLIRGLNRLTGRESKYYEHGGNLQ